MFLEHQHTLVVGVGRSSREKECNAFTFGLGLLHLLFGETFAAPEPCRGERERPTVFRAVETTKSRDKLFSDSEWGSNDCLKWPTSF